ncbi:MAG: hypothetical protein KAS30_01220, partial [Candidatus Diapherotrites archaeon]|nr:hypothetical protein [Candidatus Diapherotrites archaeon]
MKKQIIITGFFSLLAGFIFLSFLNGAGAATMGDFAYLKATFLNQDPDPAEPGKYVELRWKIEKFGSDELEDVTFVLEPQYPFSFDSSDVPEKNIGSWIGYSGEKFFYTLYYKIKVDENAVEDTYPIILKYKGSSNNWASYEYDVFVQKKDKPEFVLGSMITSPTKLVADTEDAELKIELQNIGDGDAENVKVEIELPQGISATYGYSDQSNLGSIESGAGKTASFFVDVDESMISGEQKAKLIVSYKEESDEDNEYKTKILDLSIPVKDKPLFEVSNVKSNPEQIKAGDVVELR